MFEFDKYEVRTGATPWIRHHSRTASPTRDAPSSLWTHDDIELRGEERASELATRVAGAKLLGIDEGTPGHRVGFVMRAATAHAAARASLWVAAPRG